MYLKFYNNFTVTIKKSEKRGERVKKVNGKSGGGGGEGPIGKPGLKE